MVLGSSFWCLRVLSPRPVHTFGFISGSSSVTEQGEIIEGWDRLRRLRSPPLAEDRREILGAKRQAKGRTGGLVCGGGESGKRTDRGM